MNVQVPRLGTFNLDGMKEKMPGLRASRLMHQKHTLKTLRLEERRTHGKNVNKWIVCTLSILKNFLIGKEKAPT